MNPVIQVDGLGKSFGATRALDGVDLAVRRGTVLGLLGPNGSGKTTTVRVLAALPARPAAARRQARAAELIDRFGLADAAGRRVRTYSGGMRRRLDLAVSLIGRPDVLFLDEPTTGLDPRHRNEVWDHVRGLAADGVDGAAHHAVPGGGRPARRRPGRARPRPGHRRRYPGRLKAEVGGQRAARAAAAPRRTCPR